MLRILGTLRTMEAASTGSRYDTTMLQCLMFILHVGFWLEFLHVDIDTTGKTFFRVQEEAATTILQLQPSHYGKLLLRLSHFKTLLRIFASLVLSCCLHRKLECLSCADWFPSMRPHFIWRQISCLNYNIFGLAQICVSESTDVKIEDYILLLRWLYRALGVFVRRIW